MQDVIDAIRSKRQAETDKLINTNKTERSSQPSNLEIETASYSNISDLIDFLKNRKRELINTRCSITRDLKFIKRTLKKIYKENKPLEKEMI